MGEQSAKHLRGKAMEDVIFAGSDRRGPLGYCEVAITFENDGRVPIEFMPYAEITVGRRLFRDGTSEYYLNKTPCRLRDVTEFFLGTGIGTRAYSIIEQGRVGMIVSSKPEDRRFLIEEAAGITKYKLKRKAAEKKLELTNQNLLRISDVVAEQEKQLQSLRRQAEKAERYKRYRAELRDIELWDRSQRWLGLVCEEQVYERLLGDMAAERERAQAELSASEGRTQAARLELLNEEQALAELQEELFQQGHQVRLGEAENEHARKELERLAHAIDRVQHELALLLERAEQARAEHERMTAELLAMQEGASGHDGEIAAQEEALVIAKRDLAAAQQQTDAAKAEITKHSAELARLQSEERSHGRRAEELALRAHRVEEERRRHDQRRVELTEEIAAQEGRLSGLQAEKVSLVKTRAAAEERVKELKMKVSRLDKEVDQLRAELHRRRGRLHSLVEIAKRYEGFAQGTRALLKRARSQGEEAAGLVGVLADLLIAPAELEVALDAVLGERLGALVVQTHRDALAGIDFLRQSGEGRASFVPVDARPTRPGDRPQLPDDPDQVPGVRGRLLDLVQAQPGSDPGHRAVLDALLGNVLVVETVDQALAYYRIASEDGSLSPGGLVVTLCGVVIDGHGVISGGARSGQGASVLSQKREIRELEELCAEMEQRFREKEEQLAVSRAEQQHLTRQLDELQKAGHAGEMQILSLDKDLLRHREELHRTVHRLEVLATEASELLSQKEAQEREAEEGRLHIRGVREALVRAEAERDRHGKAQLHLLDQVEALSHELTRLKVQVAARNEKLAALRGGIARLDRDAEERAAQRERLLRDEAAQTARSAELREQVARRAQELLEQAAAAKRLQEELAVKRAAYEERRGRLLASEGDLQKQRSREAQLVKEASRLELKLSELRVQRGHLEQAALERHRVELRQVVHDYHLRPPVTEKEEKRARELADLIDRMGEINLMAIEECRELEGRYSFLVAQKSDLEAAVRQLQQAITLINQTCRKRFREVFDLVNAKFQEVFPRCFMGGQARLVLTNEEDLLETGIEIVAQPPGKKNQTVELLSGGEKAMTAVALIFAIFLIKPSPFCLLDEVDAPLDEANVGRFNDLVREMTDRSQFIIITHNKRTMQIADTLYGVTMEEPGVSKLVSVNMGEISKLEKRARAA
jgi:chromosome segregation protein